MRPVVVLGPVLGLALGTWIALILGLVALAALLLAAQVPLTGGTGSWRAGALVAIMLLGGVPALVVMLAVRLAAGGDELSSTPGGQVADLIALRRLLQRLLPALGSLVALSTLALGAAMAIGPEPSAGSAVAPLPEEAVTFFGAGGSLLVGLAYRRRPPCATAGRPCPTTCSPSARPRRPRPCSAWPRSASAWSSCSAWTGAASASSRAA